MIHLNALDFNVCRSEEGMFLLMLSVWVSVDGLKVQALDNHVWDILCTLFGKYELK